jgi:membrane protease YdiL (CAAX protease family)
MASSEKSGEPSAVAKLSLGLLLAIGLVRTVALSLANGISVLGFTLAGSTRPLTLALAGTKIWIVVVDVLTVYLVVKLLAREGASLTPLLTPRPVAWNLLRALGALIIVYFAFSFGGFAGNLLIYYGAPSVSDAVTPPVWLGLVRLIVVPVTVAVAEESLFRGYLLPRLEVLMGRVGAVIVSSLLAAAQYFAFSMGNWDSILAGFIGYFIVNLAFGALYLWFKRLAPLILAHWFFEAIAGYAILTVALRH